MIKIQKPELSLSEHYIIISARFECGGVEDSLWYKLPEKYKKYLVLENLDAFVVGLLFLGLKRGLDIKTEGPISARLFSSLTNYVIPALCSANPEYRAIKILPNQISKIDLNEKKCGGAGLSCGVDSLATYFENKEEKNGYGVNYFFFFNVGAHGEFGGSNARDLYYKRLDEVKGFSNLEGKELITFDSNLSEILNMKFQQTYNLRNISCVLLVQKLIKLYYYATGTKFDHFAINNAEIADMDMLIIPCLSTESVQFYPSALQYNRVERTRLISGEASTYNYLNVCVHSHLTTDRINCSVCYKCMRTQLTLEIIGRLEHYKNVFDLEKYYSNKEQYLGALLSKKHKLTLDHELLALIKIENYRLSWKVYYYAIKMAQYRLRKRIKKKRFV